MFCDMGYLHRKGLLYMGKKDGEGLIFESKSGEYYVIAWDGWKHPSGASGPNVPTFREHVDNNAVLNEYNQQIVDPVNKLLYSEPVEAL